MKTGPTRGVDMVMGSGAESPSTVMLLLKWAVSSREMTVVEKVLMLETGFDGGGKETVWFADT